MESPSKGKTRRIEKNTNTQQNLSRYYSWIWTQIYLLLLCFRFARGKKSIDEAYRHCLYCGEMSGKLWVAFVHMLGLWTRCQFKSMWITTTTKVLYSILAQFRMRSDFHSLHRCRCMCANVDALHTFVSLGMVPLNWCMARIQVFRKKFILSVFASFFLCELVFLFQVNCHSSTRKLTC